MSKPNSRQSFGEYWRPRYYYVMWNITSNKLYLGQTTQDINKYLGSGSYWKKHCVAYGGYKKTNIELIEYKWIDEVSEASNWLEEKEYEFPEYWLSESWANQVPENILNNPWYGSTLNNNKVSLGIHPFQKQNVKPETLEKVLITSFGSEKFKTNLIIKYGVDNIMKIKEVSIRAGVIQSETKNTQFWLESIEPLRCEKFKESMSTLNSEGKNKWEIAVEKGSILRKEKQKLKVLEGTHQYSGGFYAITKDGNSIKISKEQYLKNKIGSVEDWEFVHPTSNEAKKRKFGYEA